MMTNSLASTSHLELTAPFPWFGGKSRAAEIIWQRFGDVPNYVEPFAGSLAVLLRRPHSPRAETVNDSDCYLSNFWRALKFAPEELARQADWPVNEADLHARHQWLVNQEEFRERMKVDPEYFDVRIAGWWVWGLCQWIGCGWCKSVEMNHRPRKRPALGRGGRGVTRKIPTLTRTGRGVHRSMPLLGGDGSGSGRGIHRWSMQDEAGLKLVEWFQFLAHRLRRVRVCCGDWTRVLGKSPTTHIGLTGVLLDPPYGKEAKRYCGLYAEDDLTLSARVRQWAIEHGNDPKLRIALCGYEGEHRMPASWQCVAWTPNGGYGNVNGGNPNKWRERVYFSPHCIRLHGS